MRNLGIESYLNIFTTLIPVIAGWKSIRVMDNAVKSFWWYILSAFFVSLTGGIVYMMRFENILLFNLFNFFEAAYLFWLINQWVLNVSVKKVVSILQILNILGFAYLIIYKGQLMMNVSDYDNLRNIVLIPLLAWLTMEIGLNSKVDLLKNYKFWFIFALLFNLSMIAIHSCMNLWVLSNNQYALHYTIHLLNAANIISYFLFAKGFICYRHQLNSSGFSQSLR